MPKPSAGSLTGGFPQWCLGLAWPQLPGQIYYLVKLFKHPFSTLYSPVRKLQLLRSPGSLETATMAGSKTLILLCSCCSVQRFIPAEFVACSLLNQLLKKKAWKIFFFLLELFSLSFRHYLLKKIYQAWYELCCLLIPTYPPSSGLRFPSCLSLLLLKYCFLLLRSSQKVP